MDENMELQPQETNDDGRASLPALATPVEMKLRAMYFGAGFLPLTALIDYMTQGQLAESAVLGAIAGTTLAYFTPEIHTAIGPGLRIAGQAWAYLNRNNSGRAMPRLLDKEWWLTGQASIQYAEPENNEFLETETETEQEDSAHSSDGDDLHRGLEQAQESRTIDMYALHLSPEYSPHINDVLGRCILGVGQRGTGKSNLAARLIEQVGEHPIPMFIGDYKQDYITLPEVLNQCVIAGAPDWEGQRECKVYWRVSKQNASKVGAHIMQRGMQLVFECLTYETLDEAAAIMTEIIKSMFAWALKQEKRVPALVVLDEAQQFLPQNQGDSRVDPAISSQLFQVFEKLNSVGRSFGFTPAFFTQRIAQIRKEVIGGSELFFLMRQTLPQDLKVYEDLIGRDEKGKLRLDRRVVQGLEQGYGIVYEGGEFFTTHFEKRDSRHLSTTPGLEDALAFYGKVGNVSLDLDDEMELPRSQKPRQQGAEAAVTRSLPDSRTTNRGTTGRPRLRELSRASEEEASLSRHPRARLPQSLQEALDVYEYGMTYRDLRAALGCEEKQAREIWQELRIRGLLHAPGSAVTEQVEAAQSQASRLRPLPRLAAKQTNQQATQMEDLKLRPIDPGDLARAYALWQNGNSSVRKLEAEAKRLGYGWSNGRCRDLIDAMERQGLITKRERERESVV